MDHQDETDHSSPCILLSCHESAGLRIGGKDSGERITDSLESVGENKTSAEWIPGMATESARGKKI